MSKEMTIIALGIWIVIVPYLGVPGSWRTTILVISGLGIALTGFLLRGDAIARLPGQGGGRTKSSYVESGAQPTEPNSHDRQEGITSLN